MNLLLDTHILLWWLADDRRLKQPARELIAASTTRATVSVVSFWEIVIKSALGRLEADVSEVIAATDGGGFSTLPVHARHARALAKLRGHHADPFDRMLVAQATSESMCLLTYDRQLEPYGPAVLMA